VLSNSKLIGDPSIFALKVIITDVGNAKGRTQVIIDNKSIGYFDEEVNLSVFKNQLVRLSNEMKAYPELENKEDNEVFDLLINTSDPKYDSTIISFVESFDDFIIRGVKLGNEIKFLWKLDVDTFYEYPDRRKKTELSSFSVSIDEIRSVVGELDLLARV